MPHYKDGTLAKLGDVVKGRGYNIKHEITGVLVGLKPGETTCNVTVATVTRPDYTPFMQAVKIDADGAVSPAANYALKCEPTLEYGQADHFEKIA